MVTYRVNNVPDIGCGAGELLSYRLEPVERGIVFQVTGQSSLITNFLAKNKFQASNGLFVDISEYPEYKESTLTIYLRGGDWMQNLKLDSTGFYSNKVRDHRVAQIAQALRELVAHVKKVSTPIWNYIPPCNFAPQYVAPKQPKMVWNCHPSYQF